MKKTQQDKNKKQSHFLQQQENKLPWGEKRMERNLQIGKKPIDKRTLKIHIFKNTPKNLWFILDAKAI